MWQKNNRGVTLLYVLMALMAVSFIGLNLIELAGSDAKSGAYYGTSEVVRMASQSGQTMALMHMEVDTENPIFDSMLTILNTFLTATSLEELDTVGWISGSATTWESIGLKEKTHSKIVAFDRDNLMVTIKTWAKSRGGAQSTNVGVYYLDGLYIKKDTVKTTIPDTTFEKMAAFRLSGNTDFESNIDIEVTGVTFLSGKLTSNSGHFTFNDYVYQEDGNYTNYLNGDMWFKKGAYLGADSTDFGKTVISDNDMIFKGAVHHTGVGVINGDVYYGGNTSYDEVVTYNGRLGWEKPVILGDLPIIGGDVWFGGNGVSTHWSGADVYVNGWGALVNMQNHAVHSTKGAYKNAGDPPPEYLDLICDNVGSFYRRDTPFSVDSALGLTASFDPDDYPELEIDEDVINSVTPRYSNGKITGAEINALWQDAADSGDLLCGNFMVLKMTQGTVADNNVALIEGTSLIDCKVVIVHDNNHSLAKFPGTTSDANVLLWVKTTNTMTQFGGPNLSYMRGVLFVDGKGLQMQPQVVTIQGATYFAPTAAHYNNSGTSIHYLYDSTVLQEMSCLGVIADPTDSSSSEVTEVVSISEVLELLPGRDHIETKLLSRQY